MRGRSTIQQSTVSVLANPLRTNPRPPIGLNARNNKNPSNQFSGPPTAAIKGGQLRGQNVR